MSSLKKIILGTCEIEINAVDPAWQNKRVFYNIAPKQLPEMAGWVISQCVGGTPSTGGFITKDISNAIDFLSTVQTSVDEWVPERSDDFRKRANLALRNSCMYTLF